MGLCKEYVAKISRRSKDKSVVSPASVLLEKETIDKEVFEE